MKTSARNAISGSIINIVSDALSAEVEISVSPETTIYSVVTHASMEELGLCAGRSVTLLIKAPFVAIATGKAAPKTSARNCVRGTVSRCETSTVSAEIVLDIGAGKTLASSITAHSAKSLGLAPGKSAFALFDAVHVTVATASSNGPLNTPAIRLLGLSLFLDRHALYPFGRPNPRTDQR